MSTGDRELQVSTTKVLRSLLKLLDDPDVCSDVQYVASHADKFRQTLFTLEKSDILSSETYDIASDFLSYLRTQTETGAVEKERYKSALEASANKLALYLEVGKYPALTFLRAVRVLDPKKAQYLVLDIETLTQTGIDVNNFGTEAIAAELAIYKSVLLDDQVCKTNGVEFWKGMMERLPILSKHAITALAIPSNSSAVERSFSTYASLLLPNRRRMKQETIKQLNALYFNQK